MHILSALKLKPKTKHITQNTQLKKTYQEEVKAFSGCNTKQGKYSIKRFYQPSHFKKEDMNYSEIFKLL